jgi:hypothetical protein
MAVAPWIVSDALWEQIEPSLPKLERCLRFPGRKRLLDRQVLRLDEWQRAGYGGGCTRSYFPSCALPARSSGRGRWSTPVMSRRKKDLMKGPP